MSSLPREKIVASPGPIPKYSKKAEFLLHNNNVCLRWVLLSHTSLVV